MRQIRRDETGQLAVGTHTAADLAERFGTPLYVYSGDGFVAHYGAFTSALSKLDYVVHYAVKANSSLGVLSLLAQQGAGADIVSGGEMKRALAAGITPDKIVFSGVGKTDDEIKTALQANIGQINVESEAELRHISQIAAEIERQAPVALRVNVNVDPGSHNKISTGQRSTKFGIPVADGEAAILYRQLCSDPNLIPRGLAIHIGSQLRKLEPFERAYQELLELADLLRAEKLNVPMLDLGGGLGVDYEGDTTPDFDAYGQMVTRIFGNREYKLGFEPGRSIAADNGVFLTRTLFVKKGEDKRFIIVDGAMNDLIRPTLYEAFHRIEPVGPLRPPETELADIVGPVCETGDYLGLGRAMPLISEGEILAVLSAGAYGAVMMSNYNTRPEAAEVMIHNGAIHVLRPKRSVDDLLKLEHNPFSQT